MSNPFDAWLKMTRELQVSHYGRDYDALARDPDLLGDTVTKQAAQIVWELGEMMNEYPGAKDWVTDRTKLNRPEFLTEAVDALHFFANVLTALGFTDGELNTAYLAKMQKNRARMASGTYDGVSDKCPECHRELEIYSLMGDDSPVPVKSYKACPEHGMVSPL